MAQKRNMPSARQVFLYWMYDIAKRKQLLDVDIMYFDDCENVDGRHKEPCEKAMFLCFACGDSNVQRCHILPKCNGGSDDVSNIHLLCHRCHVDSEHIAGERYWRWFDSVEWRDLSDHVYRRNGIKGKPSSLELVRMFGDNIIDDGLLLKSFPEWVKWSMSTLDDLLIQSWLANNEQEE